MLQNIHIQYSCLAFDVVSDVWCCMIIAHNQNSNMVSRWCICVYYISVSMVKMSLLTWLCDEKTSFTASSGCLHVQCALSRHGSTPLPGSVHVMFLPLSYCLLYALVEKAASMLFQNFAWALCCVGRRRYRPLQYGKKKVIHVG